MLGLLFFMLAQFEVFGFLVIITKQKNSSKRPLNLLKLCCSRTLNYSVRMPDLFSPAQKISSYIKQKTSACFFIMFLVDIFFLSEYFVVCQPSDNKRLH